jgi:DEAD/DEAH box helicase
MEPSSAEQAKGKKLKREAATEEGVETSDRKSSDQNARMKGKKKASKLERKEGKTKHEGEEQHAQTMGSREEAEVADINEQDNSPGESSTAKLLANDDDKEGSSGVDPSGSAVLTEASFESLGLCEPLVKACNIAGWKTATRIQKEVLPYALQGRDVIGLAETGSGKTGQFSLLRKCFRISILTHPFRFF